jgi:predicted adenylyl cyclase CyaB
MGRNVEVKARVESLDALVPGLEELGARFAGQWRMRDVFFAAPEGRLKLRTVEGEGAYLIAYRRRDDTGPSLSEYELVDVADPAALDRALCMVLGRVGQVRKLRSVYIIGRTRVHLDQVDGLGAFMELEVVLEDGEGRGAGEREADRILGILEVAPERLVERAYIDLLSEAQQKSGAIDMDALEE